MPTGIPYSPLRSSPSRCNELEPLNIEGEGIHEDDAGYASLPICRTQGLQLFSESSCWRLFIASCVVTIALSAVNLSALSALATTRTFQPLSTRYTALGLQPKRPSPYLGLENVVADPSSCRSCATFPKAFYTYDTRHGPNGELTRVYAPGDRTNLTFGGPVRAVADVYIPDYGLENCTVNLRRFKSTDRDHEQRAAEVEVYLRPSAGPVDGTAVFLDTLAFAPGKESISRPFHCPSRSTVFLEWRCPSDDCQISIPLEGVTSMTWTGTPLYKTGFRLTQYEALHCIFK